MLCQCRIEGMADSGRKVAIFDVDGTIFRASLVIRLVEELVAEGVFPQEAEAAYIRERQKWLDREGDYGSYIDALVRSFKKYLKGVHYTELADAAEAAVEKQWKQVYRYTRDLLRELKEKNYYLLAVSHSPKTMLDKFCPRLGFDKCYGTMYEIGPEDRFTGQMMDEHLIYNKANVVKRAIEKEGLTLTGSIGVGDTESDISFLELVAKPICFNPNTKLYTYARRMKWKVIVERKDVIYEL